MQRIRRFLPEVSAWALFIFMNCLLFLPRYLLAAGSSRFFPLTDFTTGDDYARLKSIFIRDNADLFRLSVDLFIIVILAWVFRKRINVRRFGMIAGLYYFIMLIYLVYSDVMFNLYHVKPIIYNDLYLLGLGIRNLGRYYILKSVGIILVAAILLWFSVEAMKWLIRYVTGVRFGILTKGIVIFISFLLMVNVLKSGTTFDPKQTFQMTFASIADNLVLSENARRNLRHFDFDRLIKMNNYDHYRLTVKPDIYLIFFESYGKILYENQQLSPAYFQCLHHCDSLLAGAGWHCTSDFSVSPVSGGGSWISYTSFLYGFDVKNQGTYLGLLRNPEVTDYTHLINYFRHQGYYSYRLNAMNEQEGPEVQLDLYGRFYGIDQWINYDDFGYTGKLYGFGPSPPDQFSLGYARQVMETNHKKPRIFFFINQNSHNPFQCPAALSDDWRALNGGYVHVVQRSTFFKRPSAADYRKAITYDLGCFTRFILQSDDPSALFVIIGDHQPPVLSTTKDDFETPVHIISRDTLLLRGFSPYGFTRGFQIGPQARAVRHEAMYSILMREILRRYGENPGQLPDYLPEGFIVHKP